MDVRDAGDVRCLLRRRITRVIRFAGHQLKLRFTGRWSRFGYAGVGFGKPIASRAYTKAHGVDWRDERTHREHVKQLSDHLLSAVGEVIPVLPVALVATVLAAANRVTTTRIAGV
jgi:glycerol-3-phosphate O-acyltransferase